jgi:acyl-coenzyme A thioesterase PaaI-like protein
MRAFQDLIPDNHCWGCGPLNPNGLYLKSFWEGEASVSTFTPYPEHMAGPKHVLNGGIVATVIDCHSICTAIADAYCQEGREIGASPTLWYATGSLKVRYLRPAPLDIPVTLQARITERKGKKTVLSCTLASAGEVCAEAEVVAVRVSETWRHGKA